MHILYVDLKHLVNCFSQSYRDAIFVMGESIGFRLPSWFIRLSLICSNGNMCWMQHNTFVTWLLCLMQVKPHVTPVFTKMVVAAMSQVDDNVIFQFQIDVVCHYIQHTDVSCEVMTQLKQWDDDRHAKINDVISKAMKELDNKHYLRLLEATFFLCCICFQPLEPKLQTLLPFVPFSSLGFTNACIPLATIPC